MADKKPEQTFTFETMAVVLYAMLESGITLGGDHYKLMSAVDGKRTTDSFQHQFRKVKARAKELQTKAKAGDIAAPVTPGKKRAGAGAGAVRSSAGRSKATGKRGETLQLGRDRRQKLTDDDRPQCWSAE